VRLLGRSNRSNGRGDLPALALPNGAVPGNGVSEHFFGGCPACAPVPAALSEVHMRLPRRLEPTAAAMAAAPLTGARKRAAGRVGMGGGKTEVRMGGWTLLSCG